MELHARGGRVARALIDAVVRPPWVRSGHFYSPLSSTEDIERALSWPVDVPGVDLREDEQVEMFRKLIPLFDGAPEGRYKPNNMYGPADAAIYQAIVRSLKPKHVIEVGAGFSTAKLLDTADLFLPDLEITCVEPYPDRLLTILKPGDDVDVIAQPVQDVPIDTFASREASDILFIDSTHIAKAGSDVMWLLLRVLPRLNKGVVVHVHDIFWPFEYLPEWLYEGRNWNENYFLHAFLCHNGAWRIELFSSWLWHLRPELVPSNLRGERPGSIWLRRS